jgi:uncharacterized protein (TIGR03083 family)
MTAFPPPDYTPAAVAEVARMAAVVDSADMTVPVPSCPGWRLEDLVGHTGVIHRWAAHHVVTLAPARIGSGELGIEPPEDAGQLAAWLAAGAAVMQDAFGPADPDAPMWAWGADKHARFWPRRMLHETAMHRADAELALGVVPSIDPAVAADGVDELLDNIPHAAYFAPNVANLVGRGEVLAFVAPDITTAWLVRLEPHGYSWRRDVPAVAATADGTARADATDLLLWLYGRRPSGDGHVSVKGDADLVARWQRDSAL